MTRDELFNQMVELPDYERSSILARIFGYFQAEENGLLKKPMTPEHFFKTVEEKVAAHKA